MIPRILHKTVDYFIFQMFKVYLLPIFLFESETKLKFFIWTLSKNKKTLKLLNEILNTPMCWMMMRPTYT